MSRPFLVKPHNTKGITMKNAFKKPVLFTLVALACVPHANLEAQHRDNDSGLGTFLCWAGGAIVGGLVGVAAYNAFSSPSDSEELNAGQRVLNDACNLQTKYASRYQKDCSYIVGGNNAINELKYSIVHGGSRRSPYVRYASKLSDDISSTQHSISKLCNKKSHLFERKMELTHHSDKMTRQERECYSEQYEKLIEQITRQIDTLQAMCNDLRHLETTILGLPEYREEQLLSQINNLENKIDHMNHQVYVYQPAPVVPCWYEPVTYYEPAPYYEPTVILQGNINVVDSAPRPSSSSWGWGVGYSQSFS